MAGNSIPLPSGALAERRTAWAVAAGSIAGVCLWVTGASFDLVGADTEPIRLAMFPPLGEALVLAFAGALLAVALARLTAAGAALLPLLALVAVVLPYVPVVPDVWPALTVMAGPLKYLWWAVVLTVAAHAGLSAARSDRLSRRRVAPGMAATLVLLVSIAVYAGAASRVIGNVFPGGDEPHYLVMAQSLWRDGDLRIENNHARGDVREHFPRDLEPHYLTRGVDGEIYSVHPVGLPVLLAPVYALGGYNGAVAAVVVMAALTSLLLWRLARRITGSSAAATFAWAGCSLSAPFVFNSFTIYPEMAAALMVVTAYAAVTGAEAGESGRARPWFVAGCALATLPWLSTKYVLMAGALGVVALGRLWWPATTRSERPPAGSSRSRDLIRRSLALTVPPAASLVGWLSFFWIVWGTFSPSAPYGGAAGIALAHLVKGAPGLLFDQEYGALVVAPALWLGVSGLWVMTRDSAARRPALEIAAVCTALLATVGAFHLWWGGSGAVGRPIIAALPLLGVPMAWRFHQRRGAPALRAAYLALVAVGLVVVFMLATEASGRLLANDRDGTSTLLEWWSTGWTPAALLPTFIFDPLPAALAPVALWVALGMIASRILGRVGARLSLGGAGLLALTVIAVVVGAASLAAPVARGEYAPAPPRLEARAESRLLSAFSPARRPFTIRYDPLRVLADVAVPAEFRFVARPDDGRPPAPVALLHNARWTLPPGRYRVELAASGSAAGAPGAYLDLQLGRRGEPADRWPVRLDVGGRWAREFDLPLFVTTVGFQASAALAALGPSIVLTPLSIVDASSHPPPLEVVNTARYGRTWIFFHTDGVFPERDGFWTRGGESTEVTLVADAGRVPSLRLRAGPVPAAGRVRSRDSSEPFQLATREARVVTPPATVDRVWRAVFDTTGFFVPADVDPASTDRARLGVWVELSPEPGE